MSRAAIDSGIIAQASEVPLNHHTTVCFRLEAGLEALARRFHVYILTIQLVPPCLVPLLSF